VNSAGVLLVTRRYWPLPGGWEKIWMRLLSELVRRGRRATVLTMQRHPEWPTETVQNGVRIVRIAPPAANAWGEYRYLQRLTRAVESRRKEFNVALVAGLRSDAYALVEAGRRGRFPVVLQPEQPGLAGDCHWQLDARCGNRIKRRCYRADAFLAATPLLERELIAAGYARSRIRRIEIGVEVAETATQSTRNDARRALAQADPALALVDDEPLVVCVGRLRLTKGCDVLLSAWQRVAHEVARGTLWFVGEGPDAEALRRRVQALGLSERVCLTGAFDDVDDVYRAADVVVCPAVADGPAVALLEACGFGLPVVSSDAATHRDRLANEIEALLYARYDADALAESLIRTLRNPTEARRRGEAARLRIVREHAECDMVDQYERLFDELTHTVAARAAV